MEMTQIEKDLNALRISVARIAQVQGVEHPGLQVLGKGYSALYFMARDNEYGWNTLASMVKDTIAFAPGQEKAVFWIAKIEKYEKYDYSLNYETEASEYFQDEANAKAWLLEAQTEIAPLDQWVDGKYEDDYSGIYMPFIYQLRTKD